MSLKGFHIVFITLSCTLAASVGIWCLRGDLVGFGILSFAAAAVLAVYGVWFLRKLRKWNANEARRKTRPIVDRPGSSGGGSLAAPHVGV